ncbi:MAG: nucleotidyltransferase [Bacteroidetes bacterium GWF2_38_335]|nr:MAG: nucleotidyltransferase [Bacteroidetes bacterium GWF2_38_335]OFY81447.1 MAG: nucleotidyltransferase [Bacteroidetes bacterium RIFOXYA12_FULL_38_20]HBS85551.1 nucleotidyltransferase [Bacteroidales bacterium]
MVNPAIIETLKNYILLIPDDLGIKKAYLFGSFAKGSEREDSDIDIALILENMPDFFSTQMLLMRLRRKIDLRIEPHPISIHDFNLSNPFAYEIQKTGIEISVKD